MWIYIIVYFFVNGFALTPESARHFKDRDIAVFWLRMDQSEFIQHRRPYIALMDSVWVSKSIRQGDAIYLKGLREKIYYSKQDGLKNLKNTINGKVNR